MSDPTTPRRKDERRRDKTLDGDLPKDRRPRPGIDAPEICQSGGETSRDLLARRVLNQVVEVRVRAQDDYGRSD